jgi:two-component system OmpR family sensor kinase
VRLRDTLERLLALPATDLETALSEASDHLAGATRADKVDAFLHDEARQSLVALGTSRQPLSTVQRKLGLDVLALANGGRIVESYVKGETFASGRLDLDPNELRGTKESLGVRSMICVPLVVGGARRGVIAISSQTPELFTDEDVRFVEAATRLVGMVAHRAELVSELTRRAAEESRRAVADELVTVLAHDLRNYLGPLEFRVGMLKRRATQAEDIRDAELALRGISRLTAVIEDLLDAARIDQGLFQMEPKAFALHDLARDVATTFSTPEHPIEVKVSDDVNVIGDPKRVRQCIMNLISNAIEHSPKATPVSVVVSRGRPGFARLDIRDQGPGVPPHILPKIFDRYVGKSSHQGLGLGLYLAKRIAVMHGGDLSVESQPNQGARFTLCLPLADGA